MLEARNKQFPSLSLSHRSLALTHFFPRYCIGAYSALRTILYKTANVTVVLSECPQRWFWFSFNFAFNVHSILHLIFILTLNRFNIRYLLLHLIYIQFHYNLNKLPVPLSRSFENFRGRSSMWTRHLGPGQRCWSPTARATRPVPRPTWWGGRSALSGIGRRRGRRWWRRSRWRSFSTSSYPRHRRCDCRLVGVRFPAKKKRLFLPTDPIAQSG